MKFKSVLFFLQLSLVFVISITYNSCKKEISGCTDLQADNYNSDATVDDGSCTYSVIPSDTTIIIDVGKNKNIQFSRYEIAQDDNSNNKIEKGETIFLRVFLQNTGNQVLENVQAKFVSVTPSLKNLTQEVVNYETISDGTEKFATTANTPNSEVPYTVRFEVSPDALPDDILKISLEVTESGGEIWTEEISIVVADNFLRFYSFAINNDESGDAMPNAGENITSQINIENLSNNQVTGLKLTVATDSEYIYNMPSEEIDFGSIPIGAVKGGQFQFSIRETAPANTLVVFYLTMTDENENIYHNVFTIELSGRIEPLIQYADYSIFEDNITAGKNYTLDVTLINNGKVDANNVRVIFTTNSLHVDLETNTIDYGTIQIEDSVTKPIEINISGDLLYSENVFINLQVIADSGYTNTDSFAIPIAGTISIPDGLIAFYPFDETAIDVINGNDGILNNVQPVNDTPNLSGHAMYFDGNGYISFTNFSLASLSEFSLNMWIKSHAGSNEYILSQGSGTDDVIKIKNNQVIIGSYKFNQNISDLLLDGEWNMFTLVMEEINASIGSNMYLYVNGGFIEQKTFSDFSVSSNSNLYIGSDYTKHNLFDGNMDNIRIYNRILNQYDIEQIYNIEGPIESVTNYDYVIPNGLVAYYTFDYQNITDEVNNFNGASSNVNYDHTDKPNMTGFSANFNGTSYIEIHNNFLNELASMSLNLWVKTQKSNENYILNQGNNDNSYIKIHDNKIHVGKYIFDFNVSTKLLDGQWHMLTIMIEEVNFHSSKNNAFLYIDGNFVQQNADNTFIDFTASNILDFFIGSNDSQSHLFDGKMDNIRIYNRILSQSEITEIYNNIQ